MRRARVAFVDHAQELGGAEKSLSELVAHLDRQRFEPLLLCAESADWVDRPELADVEKVRIWPSSRVLSRRRDELTSSALLAGRELREGVRLIDRARRAFRELHVDIVHTNTLKAHVLGGIAARLARLPLVWHMRDILDPGAARSWLLRAARVGWLARTAEPQIPQARAASLATVASGCADSRQSIGEFDRGAGRSWSLL